MQAKRRVFASAVAASGSSNAPGTTMTVTASCADAGRLELLERALEQPRRDRAVEPRDDDADGAPAAVGVALEHRVAVRDLELAGGVLVGELDRHRRAVVLELRCLELAPAVGLGSGSGSARARLVGLGLLRRRCVVERVSLGVRRRLRRGSRLGSARASCVTAVPRAATSSSPGSLVGALPLGEHVLARVVDVVGSCVLVVPGVRLEAHALVVQLRDRVPELLALRGEVAARSPRCGVDLDRHLLDDGEAEAVDARRASAGCSSGCGSSSGRGRRGSGCRCPTRARRPGSRARGSPRRCRAPPPAARRRVSLLRRPMPRPSCAM